MFKSAAELTHEIRAFLREQARFGDGYRDATGNYSPARYDEHNRLVRERNDAMKREASIAKMMRRSKATAKAAAKRWRVETGEGKIAYVATKAGKAGERQAMARAGRLMRERGGAYFAVAP
jgi:hypothetical protein